MVEEIPPHIGAEMDPLQIVKIIRDSKSLSSLESSFDDIKLAKTLFSNIRYNDNTYKGMKLTYYGFTILSKILRYWTFNLPDDYFLKSKHLLALDSRLNGPWCFEKRCLHIFNDDDALIVKMIGCDLDFLFHMI